MLAGVSGHLVSTAFLESAILPSGDPDVIAAARRELTAWRARHRFGPASSTRTLLESGASPLSSILGFGPPADEEPNGRLLAATLRGNGRSVALLVSPYGERFDPLWRIGIAEALRRSAA